MRALRIATDVINTTTIVSIYQASELLYALFNKVAVLSQGRLVYFGPASEARAYFINMGYEPANRQSTADFLVAVTDDLGRRVRDGFETNGRRVPRTPAEMADAFVNSELGRRNKEDVRAYIAEMGHASSPSSPSSRPIALPAGSGADAEDEAHTLNVASNPASLSEVGGLDEKSKRTSHYIQSARAERAKHTRPGSAYTISVPMQVRAVMLRRVQIMRGDWTAQAIQIL